MPQDSLRSVVYRSFVTCDDPRGVVEGKAIKISKTGSAKMDAGSRKIENETRNRSSSPHRKEEKEKMSCKRATKVLDVEKNPASCQLVEVKKGAQKLNQVVDSWSKGKSFEGQPKDIAKDLLKGALDLQESLMMLGKLQEASQFMAKLKKKHKVKPNEEVLGSRIGSASARFESLGDFGNADVAFQKSRHSVDGSSRDCYEELRDVIRDGLTRQNLLPNKSYEESALWDRRKLPFSPDIASTSSSRSSSMVYSSQEFTSSDSFSSRATEKSKGSNLIAKLMGLEELPPKAQLPSPQKQFESSKIKDQKRPLFDIDLPNARKSQFVIQKSDREQQMTLDEIIEMMQSKGLLRSDKPHIHQTTGSDTDKSYNGDAPLIVIMKPHRSGLEQEFCKQKIVHEEKAVENRKSKAEARPIKILHQEKAKAEDKELKPNKGKLPSNKQKASVPIVPKPPRKEETEKKVDKIQRIAPPVRRKPVENAKSISSAHKTSPSKQAKPQKSSSSTPILKRTSVSTLSTTKSSDRNRNLKIEKVVSKPLPTNVKTTEEADGILQIQHARDNQTDLTKTDAITVPCGEGTEDSKILIEEIHNASQYSVCEATQPTAKSKSDNEDFRADTSCINDRMTEMSLSETKNHQEVSIHSDFSDCKARILEAVCVDKGSEPANSKLLLDCVDKFLEHANLQKIPTVHPLLQNSISDSRFCISEDQLVREVTYGIEYLRNDSKLLREDGNSDTVYGLLARDLWWKGGAVGGVWSTGWRDCCTLDDVEEVVFDLEKNVLSKLIDDLLGELVAMHF